MRVCNSGYFAIVTVALKRARVSYSWPSSKQARRSRCGEAPSGTYVGVSGFDVPTRIRTWNQGPSCDNVRSRVTLARCNRSMVGPPGFEPGTKGFANPDRFRPARTISSPAAECRFAGGVRDALACDQGRSSPQVVSAPSDGVPPAWLRIASGRTAEVSLNSSRSRPLLSRRRHLLDESPALTVEL